MKVCEQGCGRLAQWYGGGPKAGDWAGYYCEACIDALGFQRWDEVRFVRQFNDGEQEG